MTDQFSIVKEYLATRMGTPLDVPAGRTTVVESQRRLTREAGYGYTRALWWLWLEDGRSLISVPPGAAGPVQEVVRSLRSPLDVDTPEIVEKLKSAVNPALKSSGVDAMNRSWSDVCFACGLANLCRHELGSCVRLTDETIPPGAGLKLPTHCFPDGVAFGVVADGAAVSIAFSHRHGVMEDQVADLAVETAEPYRRKGYARTVVSAVVAHFTTRGGEALYVCRPDNVASIATAKSVGFVAFGRSLVLSAPARL